MTIFAICIFCSLAMLLCLHFIFVWNFCRVIKGHQPKPLQDSECPKTIICLNLRGMDPFLAIALPKLLDQDYPNYDVFIVVDHPDDPVYKFAQNLVLASGKTNVKIEVLTNRKPTCSLVNSALLQTIQNHGNEYEVVAMIDADAVPHKTWLRELLAPFRDKNVGTVTGQRWYFPPRASLGDLVRYIWNIPAVLQMVFFKIPWGGSLAIRMDVFKECKVADYYEKTLVQDVPLFDILKKSGYSVQFAPFILMVNRESITLSSLVPWIQRQLLWAILYHSCWWKIVIHGILITMVPVGILSMMINGLMLHNTRIYLPASVCLLAYGLITLSQLLLLENQARKIVKRRGESVGWLNPLKFLTFMPALLVAQLVYPKALLFALFSRKIEWRGIHYQIQDPYNVKMLFYEPYKSKNKDKNSL
jgi:cellulose synthase/poly-beta-1,6-N-acetylglucosamine synthase-like glycosyltransferase